MSESDLRARLASVLQRHANVLKHPHRRTMIQDVVEHKEAFVAANGALATWTPPESTGRSPKDTYIVCHGESAKEVDWSSPDNNPLDPETFDSLFEDALETLAIKDRVYVTDRVIGADVSYALPVRTVTDEALTALFTDNMFRPMPDAIDESALSDRTFTLVALPYDKLDRGRYRGQLRTLPDGETSNMAVAMDFERMMGVVYGSVYGGTVKKMLFTVMNYLTPDLGILPLHCSATEGPGGDCALLLGLSGTGKTTLSADPRRALLGDDEHGWSDRGIANFENGCYAKMIHLEADKEPEIWRAVLHKAHFLDHGAILENALMYPDGTFDLDDERLTPNSRASYPLSFLRNVKQSAISGHPETILFLTADANGVLPPVAKLTTDQAMLWFLMGYTSKLAGTETGVEEPVSTFSRFFGAPFMPRHPDLYDRLLGERLERHGTRVYLVNTGWTGGPYGVGERMDIHLTREIVHNALSGALEDVEYVEDELFHLWIPTRCPGVPTEVLSPRNTWSDKEAYDRRARALAQEFQEYFDRTFSDEVIEPAIAAQCPGA